MIKLDESEFLVQMIETIEIKARALELSYRNRDYIKAKEIKVFILKVQEKINEIVEKSKR
mgnify:CR=1 FL=1